MAKRKIYGNDPKILAAFIKKEKASENAEPPYEDPNVKVKEGEYNNSRNPAWEVWNREHYKIHNEINAYHREQHCRVLEELHVPKELALKLASLGFNEKCYRIFYAHADLLKEPMRYLQTNFYSDDQRKKWDDDGQTMNCPISPTLDQIINWFREKYDIDFIMGPKRSGGEKLYECIPVGLGFSNVKLEPCKTLREAELQAFEYLCDKVERLPYKLEDEHDDEHEDVDYDEVAEISCND